MEDTYAQLAAAFPTLDTKARVTRLLAAFTPEQRKQLGAERLGALLNMPMHVQEPRVDPNAPRSAYQDGLPSDFVGVTADYAKATRYAPWTSDVLSYHRNADQIEDEDGYIDDYVAVVKITNPAARAWLLGCARRLRDYALYTSPDGRPPQLVVSDMYFLAKTSEAVRDAFRDEFVAKKQELLDQGRAVRSEAPPPMGSTAPTLTVWQVKAEVVYDKTTFASLASLEVPSEDQLIEYHLYAARDGAGGHVAVPVNYWNAAIERAAATVSRI